MSRGYPDYNRIEGEIGAYSSDITELASRLGSPNRISRKGLQIFSDTFENGIHSWAASTTGGASVIVDSTYSNTGGNAVKLGVSAVTTDLATLFTYLPIHDTGIYGFEATFATKSNPTRNGGYLYLSLNQHRARQDTESQIRFDLLNNTVAIGKGPNVPLSTLLIDTDGLILADTYTIPIWHWFKLTANFATHYYSRLMVDTLTYDLSRYPMGVIAGDNVSNLSLGINYQSKGNVSSVWVDNVIVTMADV